MSVRGQSSNPINFNQIPVGWLGKSELLEVKDVGGVGDDPNRAWGLLVKLTEYHITW